MGNFPCIDTVRKDGHTYQVDQMYTFLGGHVPTLGIRQSQKAERKAYGDSEQLRGDDMPGKVDEGLWAKAKKAAKKQYPDKSDDSPSFWKIVSTVYKKMGGKFSKDMKKALDFFETLERITPSFIQDHRVWLKAVQKAGGSLIAPQKALENLGLTIRSYAEMGGRLQKSSMLDTSPEAVRRRNIGAAFEKGGTPGGVKPHHAYTDRTPKGGGGWKYKYGPSKAEIHPGSQKVKTGVPQAKHPSGEGGGKTTGMARAMDILNKKSSKDQKAALQNVSPDALAALHTSAPAKSSLKQAIAGEVASRKAEAARRDAPKKDKAEPVEKADKGFEDFCKSWQGEVSKSLAASNPSWDSKTLHENTRAQLQQLYRRS